jgi:3-methyl-2-oxobutanoate hydroxymethyltransferase
MKRTIKSVFNKKNKKKIICLTSYSYNFTKIIDDLVDVVLVGDSMGNVLYGMDTTRSVDDQIMVNHATAVKKVQINP